MPFAIHHKNACPSIVIAGGGLVGLACALALHDAVGSLYPVVIADPLFINGCKPDVRSSALTNSSRNLLRALGVWSEIESYAQPVAAMDISDARLEQVLRPIYLTFEETAQNGEPLAFIIPNSVLHQALLNAIKTRNIKTYSTAISTIENTSCGALVHLTDGEKVPATVVIAADGARSALRQQAGIPDYGWRYHHSAIVTTIAHTQPHNGRATQHFLEGGPFALLPLPENRSSVVWTENHEKANAIMALPDDAFCAALAERVGTFLGAVSVVSSRASHPLSLRMARRFIAERLVLIGDAAHGVHPVAGQGVNLGFKDVAALTQTLEGAAALGADCGTRHVLQRYEQWRRFDTLTMLGVTDALVRLFGTQTTPVRLVRDFGLGLVDRLPWIKKTLISAASGGSETKLRLLQNKL